MAKGGNGNANVKSSLNAIRGTSGDDLLVGTDAADLVDGKSGNDTLFGGLGDDLIQGDQGNDMLIGGAGNDTLDGGADTDTALYIDDTAGTVTTDPAAYASVLDYDIAIGATSTTITDLNGADGDTGIDTLVNVEQAVFSDGDADGDGTAELVTVFLDGQNNSVLAVADSGAGVEDTAITFTVDDLIGNDIEFDGDTKELLSVQGGVNGTVSFDGTTVTFNPDADYSGEASFTYTVSDGLGGTDTQTVTIDVVAVADAPTVATLPSSGAGDEDTAIALNLSVTSTDTDGSETVSLLSISDIPVGATLSDGVNSFIATAGNTEVDVSGWNPATLTITPPEDSDAGFELTVTAEATEASNGDTETTVETIAVTVNAIADAPVLDLDSTAPGAQSANGVSVDEDTAVALDVSSALTDTDGSEILSVVVSVIPVGATLSDGMNSFTATLGSAEVDISGWNQAALTITPPANSDVDFQLTVTATSTELSNDDTASTVGTIDVVVTGVVDTPVVTGSGVGDEDTAIALNLSAATADTDGSETLSVVVSMIPVGATLSDGGLNSFIATAGNTQVDVSGWDQSTITITPPADRDENIALTVTATATEGGDTASTVGTINVTVNAVADAPVLDLSSLEAGGQTVGSAIGGENTTIALDLVEASLTDTDGSETLSVVVSVIPVGAILSDGFNTFTSTALDSDVDILSEGWDLSTLTITPPPGSDASFQLQVTATSMEANGDTATTQGSIDVTVVGEAGAPTVDLGAMAPTTGFTLYGADASDQAGWSVSSAGDVNGDGFDDVVIGALNATVGAGESYVVFGKAGGFGNVDLGLLTPADGFTIHGTAGGDQLGSSVSSAGDINGDGFDDIIIGATGAGESHVIFGKASGFGDINVSDDLALTGEGFTIHGAVAGDNFGSAVSSAGDINGDGFDDIIVGAGAADSAGLVNNGESYVIFGHAGGFGDIDLSTNVAGGGDGIITITGGATGTAGDQAGSSVSSAGDVNGDGIDDIIIGALQGDGPLDTEGSAGESYVIYGKTGGWGDIDLSAPLSPADGFTIYGADSNDRAGFSVASAGDVNGDGFADIIIGATGADGVGNDFSNSGESYVIFGSDAGIGDIDLSTVLTETEGFTIRGEAGDQFGRSVSSAGDVNGDGFDDIIVGAWLAETDSADNLSGQSFVVFGKADGFGPLDVDTMTPLEGFTILGADGGDRSGSSVSSAGDVNGDGYDDLIVGAPLSDSVDNVTASTGESYIIFGSDLTGAVTLEGTAGDDLLTGTLDADVIVAGQGDDTVIGGGGADVLIGGSGNDVLSIGDTSFARIDGGTGFDKLAFEGGGQTLDLTGIGSMEVQGIEAIDLSGTGANTLTLNTADVLQLSDETNDLLVFGNGDDIVNLQGDFAAVVDETTGEAVQETIDGTTFNVYASPTNATNARVLAEDGDVTVTINADAALVIA